MKWVIFDRFHWSFHSDVWNEWFFFPIDFVIETKVDEGDCLLWSGTSSSIWWRSFSGCAVAPLAGLWCVPARIWAHLHAATFSPTVDPISHPAIDFSLSISLSTAPTLPVHFYYRHICPDQIRKQQTKK